MKKLLSLLAISAMTASALMAADENPCIKFKTQGATSESNAWDSEALFDLSTTLTKGAQYTLSMRIKSTQAGEIGLWPIDTKSTNRNQWNNSDDVQYLNSYTINETWTTYTWKFTAEFPIDRLQWVFGKINGTLYFDDVVLKEDAVGVNLVTNGDFNEKKTDGWSVVNWTGTTYGITDSDNDTSIKKEPVIPNEYPLAEQGDPNFHIYLCFGQSNMEGNAAVEAEDKVNVPERFQMMAAVDFPQMNRKKGVWYTAVPPLCRQGTGLTPADYFGRELVAKLPEEIKVGVINVAVGGARIELFMEEFKDDYIAGEAQWFRNYCAEYNNDPLGRLIEMGKIAQKSGVIKGILLHQGESNNGQADWADKVKKVHKRICYHLGIRPEDTPLLAGETLYKENGGACYWHNEAALPNLTKVMDNAYIISAKGLPGNNVDPYHFSAAGYRTIGRRYAEKMLELLKADTNSIEGTIDLDNENGAGIAIYDFSGHACNEISTPGFYIVGDKKILVK